MRTWADKKAHMKAARKLKIARHFLLMLVCSWRDGAKIEQGVKDAVDKFREAGMEYERLEPKEK